MSQTVVSMFKSQDEAEKAIKDLKELDYKPSEISVLMKDLKKIEGAENDMGTSVAKGAGSGAAVGGAVGGLTGLLVGAGVFAIPGLGALLLAGPVAGALGLSGAAASTTTGALSGALTGGLVGGLVGIGFSDEEAEHYEALIKSGGILLIVPVKEQRITEVRDLLEKNGATDVRQLELHSSIQS